MTTTARHLNNLQIEAVRMMWIGRYKVRPTYQWCQSLLNLAIAKDIEPRAIVARFPEKIPPHGPYPYLGWLRSNKAEAREALILRDGEESYMAWFMRIAPIENPAFVNQGAGLSFPLRHDAIIPPSN